MRRNTLFALVLAAACGSPERKPDEPYPLTGRARSYDIEITEFDWDVAPGAVYRAVGYNGSIPGPIIEAEAGDRIVIRLKNNTSQPRSIHTHVVKFDVANDGAKLGIAPPGQTITIEWNAVFAGTFPYHDHAGATGESDGVAAGLFGALVVHAPDAPRSDVENVVVLSDMDMSRYKGLPEMPIGTFPATNGEYHGEHQYMHTLNGRAYHEWAPRFRAKVGDRVRWRILSIGSEFHTFHVHGHRWTLADGTITDNVTLGPGTYTTFDWVEDNPGEWMYHCHVPSHMEGGMMGTYEVSP